MEFLFELIVEIFGEALLQIVFGALSEAGLHIVRHPDREPRATSPWLLATGYALLGALLGGLSLLAFPHALIHAPAARLLNLLLGPTASGLTMAILGAWRRRRGQQVLTIDRFAYGFVMGLGMALVRWQFAG